MKTLVLIILLAFNLQVNAESIKPRERILIGTDLLEQAKLKPETQSVELGLSTALVSEQDKEIISSLSHEFGRCGGFELLPETMQTMGFNDDLFENIKKIDQLNRQFSLPLSVLGQGLQYNPQIEQAVNQISEDQIAQSVTKFSNYFTRHHASQTNNQHVIDLKNTIQQWISASSLNATVDLISHTRTTQKSLRVHIDGSERPQEVVVLGGHFDSINGWFSKNQSPGADDNASGSASILEALRVILSQGVAPKRSVEFFWYAAEEVGLVGSQEIAESYKAQRKDVIGALQLDMTMFPGDGLFALGSMTDYTSSWLRQMLVDLNEIYIHGTILESKCGYGCSDHASWYRQGYPTLMPFEATFDGMNKNIHTLEDVVSEETSFKHAAMFSKIALAYALELSNSAARQPY